jgi:hypothetical protein
VHIFIINTTVIKYTHERETRRQFIHSSLSVHKNNKAQKCGKDEGRERGVY